MPHLNKQLAINNNLVAPPIFQLPERVLQFGTGVLLRGLPDYLIDRANKSGIFNGRAVVIKTTNSDASDFPNQDCLFTLIEKGVDNQQVVNQSTVIAALSRLMNASDEWAEILALAEKSDMDIVISNTTEAGIKYVEEDIFASPPQSFPAKLTAWLFRKYKNLGRKAEVVIVPTELLIGNGDILKNMVERHAKRQKLGKGFQNWLNGGKCRFCNSLVDRIVPGATPTVKKLALEKKLGYIDNLMIDSEPFLLWAIEGDEFVREKLSFAKADSRMVILENIDNYREQKLRLLNGGHTISVPFAYLKGLKTVKEMMNDAEMSRFTEGVILEEILTTLPFDAADFAQAVLNRFRNPFVEHKLTSILVQNSTKMNARNAATIQRFFEKNRHLPNLMTKGFAAYILYTKNLAAADDHADFFQKTWAGKDVTNLEDVRKAVSEIVGNAAIFDIKLAAIPNFIETVAAQILVL